MCLLSLKTLDLLGPGQLKRDVPYFWYLPNYFYLHHLFFYLSSGAAVNVTSAGLFLATHNSYLIKKVILIIIKNDTVK